MSRCFPFPPPGYEKKARTDDVDFLKKENQKEKKHKKDKDKEKRENKEKKEKDRSDGKHKDKKDKKEKHKDKKKEKDRDKEKDRSNNLEENKVPGHPEGQNGEKTVDEKKLPGKSEGQSGEKSIPKEKGRDKDRSSFSTEKKLGGKFSGYNGDKTRQNSRLAEDFRDAKFVQELGRRVRDEGAGAENSLVENNMGHERRRGERMVRLVAKTVNALAEEKENNKRSDDRKFDVQGIRDERILGAGAGNRLVEKFMGTEQRRDVGMVRLVAKTTIALAEEKEKNKRSDDRKFDVQGIRDERRSGGNDMVHKIAGGVNARVERIQGQVESNTEKQDEGREKKKEKGENKIRDKHKDNDREKKSHGKDKDRDKEEKKRKKEEKAKAKAKAKGHHRNSEADNLKGSNKDDPVGFNPKASDSSKEGNNGAVVEENHRKRKDCEKNGFLHVNDHKPNKMMRASSLLTDNGRSPESCQAPISLTSDSHGAGNGLKVDAKEHKLNGTSEAQLLFVSPPTHLSASAQASQIDEVSTKSPHSDSIYLIQVLSLPEMEEWSGFDDQSWLFHSNESELKKSKVGFSEIDEAPQVWAEALQMESADVCALPYVIPY